MEILTHRKRVHKLLLLKVVLVFWNIKCLYFCIQNVIKDFCVTRCSLNKLLRKRENVTRKLFIFPVRRPIFATELMALPSAFRCRQSPKIWPHIYWWRCRYCPRLSLESSMRPSANRNWISNTSAYFNIHLYSPDLGYQISRKFNSSNYHAVCLTTGPQPLLRRVLRRVRSNCSYFNFFMFP